MKKTPDARWFKKAIAIAEAQGLTRSDLVRLIAKVVGSSESAAYSWLNGTREPTLEIIRRIAKECLKVSVGDLIEDDPYFLNGVAMTIGRRIKEARERLGMNQSELARQVGVSPQSIHQWESDETAPKRGRMHALAEILGIPEAWIQFGGTLDNLVVEGGPPTDNTPNSLGSHCDAEGQAIAALWPRLPEDLKTAIRAILAINIRNNT